MTTLTVTIEDAKQLELIGKLRGNKTAEEFVQALIGAGLAFAEQQQANAIRFTATKPEFRTLDANAITEALKDKDPQHPVKIEVSRLVQDYTKQLGEHAKKNGNKLPAQMRVNAQSAIEKVAFQITVEAIKHAATADKKTA